MRSSIYAASALAVLALAACNQQSAAPQTDASASSQPVGPPTQAETAVAPAPTSMPEAPPAPVRYAPPARRYSYLDDAYAMSRSYADRRPDYAFDYNGDAPQAWDSPQGVVRVGERVSGGWRYYYYQPGAETPYLVRDPEYAYGYENGELAVVYDSRGRQLDQSYADRQAGTAGRYLFRARELWRASRQAQRHEVQDRVWQDQRVDQDRQRQAWDQNRNTDPNWRAYHDQHQNDAQARWGAVAAASAAAIVNAQGGGQGGRDGRDGRSYQGDPNRPYPNSQQAPTAPGRDDRLGRRPQPVQPQSQVQPRAQPQVQQPSQRPGEAPRQDWRDRNGQPQPAVRPRSPVATVTQSPQGQLPRQAPQVPPQRQLQPSQARSAPPQAPQATVRPQAPVTRPPAPPPLAQAPVVRQAPAARSQPSTPPGRPQHPHPASSHAPHNGGEP